MWSLLTPLLGNSAARILGTAGPPTLEAPRFALRLSYVESSGASRGCAPVIGLFRGVAAPERSKQTCCADHASGYPGAIPRVRRPDLSAPAHRDAFRPATCTTPGSLRQPPPDGSRWCSCASRPAIASKQPIAVIMLCSLRLHVCGPGLWLHAPRSLTIFRLPPALPCVPFPQTGASGYNRPVFSRGIS